VSVKKLAGNCCLLPKTHHNIYGVSQKPYQAFQSQGADCSGADRFAPKEQQAVRGVGYRFQASP
jgi:hypothetical protein